VNTPRHHNNFDFLRLVAALCVVVSHQFALTGLREPSVLDVHSLGGFGVLVFFSLSGYLVAQSWSADPHIGRFAARRLLRIWPALAVVVLLCTFVLGPFVTHLSLHDYVLHPFFRDYLKNLVFVTRGALPMQFTGNVLRDAVNGPLWTIPLELKCYLLLVGFGVAGLLRHRLGPLLLCALLVVPYAVIEPRGEQLVAPFHWPPETRLFLEFGMFFAAGVALHYFNFDSGRRRAAVFALAVAAGVAAWLLGRPWLALWCVVPVGVVTIGGASTPGINQAGRFGDLSYGLYVWAFPIQQTLIWLNRGRLSWGTMFALTLVFSVAAAYASWHLVEKRALQWKPRRPRSPAEASGVPNANAATRAA
jgi:peptidoglycan/LPS O-acetylase OafA/YrhL